MPSLEERLEQLTVEVRDLRDRIAYLERPRSAVIGPGRFPPRVEQVTVGPTIDPRWKAALDAYAKKHKLTED
jgi:hypothetical protein